jgi:hypothetical protein
MFCFVDTYLTAAGKGEGSNFSPRPFAHLRDRHILRFEIFQRLHDVIAHEVELVLIVVLGIMEGRFEWRHGENQPAVAGINGGKLKYISKEGPVRFRILGVDSQPLCRGRGRGFESRRPRHSFQWLANHSQAIPLVLCRNLCRNPVHDPVHHLRWDAWGNGFQCFDEVFNASSFT